MPHIIPSIPVSYLQTIEIPSKCSNCDKPNFKIYGTKINDVIKISARCMSCGTEHNNKVD